MSPHSQRPRRMALLLLAGLTAASCSTTTPSTAAPPTAATTTTAATALTLTATAPPMPMSVRWEKRLTPPMMAACEGAVTFSVECAVDAGRLADIARQIKADADRAGAGAVSLLAADTERSAMMWTTRGSCLTSQPESDQRWQCIKVLMSLKTAGTELLETIYEFEQS